MAAFPDKINAVTIIVQQVLTSSAYVDPDFNEPAAPLTYDSPVSITGQVNFGQKDLNEYLLSLTGNQKATRGHIVLKEPLPLALKPGDKIVSIAGVAMELFVTQVRPESPLEGIFLLYYVEFSSNQETRTSR